MTARRLLALAVCGGTAAAAAPPSLAVLDALYPPASYNARRTGARDAALAFASSTNEDGIPIAGDEFVYGEFDAALFSRLLDLAGATDGDNFVDVGSGVGRIVLAAALCKPELADCHGIEILPELHEAAIMARQRFETLPPPLCDQPIAPCQYSCIDLYSDAAAAALQAADIAFSYSVTWERDDEGRLTTLSRVLAERLKNGARVITVGVTLLPEVADARFERVGTLSGANADTGPESQCHVFRLVRDALPAADAPSPAAATAAEMADGGAVPLLSTGKALELQTVDGPIGGRVWEAAPRLCRWMAADAPTLLRGRTVLELGSGTGVCGLYAASLGAAKVTLTDGPESVLELLESNIMRNRLRATHAAGGPVDIGSTRLRWGDDADLDALRTRGAGLPDVIIGSDLTYDDAHHAALCDTLRRLLAAAPDAAARPRVVLCEQHGMPSLEPVGSSPEGVALFADEAFDGFAQTAAAHGLHATPLGATARGAQGPVAASWPMSPAFEVPEAFLVEITLAEEAEVAEVEEEVVEADGGVEDRDDS